MNELTSIRPPREIVLAHEPPFRLSRTDVRPAELEITGPAGVRPLEPRVMKVLVALHRGLGAAVSRDSLGEQAWGGRIVSEDALTRCIVQLRKALSSDAGIVLETIPTVGYRLQCGQPAHAPDLPPATMPAPTPRRRWSFGALDILAIVLALAAAVWLWLWFDRPRASIVSDFRPLTSERSFKTYPALSPDGRQVAYAFAALPFGQRDILLRGVAGGEPVAFTSGPDDDFAPAWSPDGTRIAFIRWTPEGRCLVMVGLAPRGGEQRLADCRASGAHPSWTDDRTLVFADAPPGSDQSRLFIVDVEAGTVRPLTEPPAETLGDSEPQASPDGRFVAFRRSLLYGSDEIVLRDMRSGRERSLAGDGWKASGYAWSADSRYLFYSSNRGGAFGLWRADARDRRAEPERVSLGLGVTSFMRMSADRVEQVVVELSRPRTGLVSLGPGGEVRHRVLTDSNDWDAVEGPDGAFVHISDRAGSPDLWVSEPGGRTVHLTTRLGSYAFSPAWAPDGQSVAFVGVEGRRADIFTIARDGSRLQRLTDDGHDKRSPVVGRDGMIRYAERQGQVWRLMSVRPGEQPAPTPGGEDVRLVLASPSGRLFVQRQGSDTVSVAAGGGWRPVADVRSGVSWAPADDGVYILDPYVRPEPALWFQPLEGARRRLPGPGPMAARVTPSARGGATLGEALTEAVDLGLFRLGPAPR